MTLTAKISKLLFEDPICNGRVTADCVEAIAALIQRNADFVESGAQGSSGVEGRESESALREALHKIAFEHCEYTTGEGHARAIWISRAALKGRGGAEG